MDWVWARYKNQQLGIWLVTVRVLAWNGVSLIAIKVRSHMDLIFHWATIRSWHVMLRPWWIGTVHWTISALPTTLRPLSGMVGFEIVSHEFGAQFILFLVKVKHREGVSANKQEEIAVMIQVFYWCWLQIASSIQIDWGLDYFFDEIDFRFHSQEETRTWRKSEGRS